MRIKELRGDEQKVQPNNLERPTQQMKENRGIKKIKIRPGLFIGSLMLIILKNLTCIYYIYKYVSNIQKKKTEWHSDIATE